MRERYGLGALRLFELVKLLKIPSGLLYPSSWVRALGVGSGLRIVLNDGISRMIERDLDAARRSC